MRNGPPRLRYLKNLVRRLRHFLGLFRKALLEKVCPGVRNTFAWVVPLGVHAIELAEVQTLNSDHPALEP